MKNDTLKPALKEGRFYLGDNGRLCCWRLHCAGMTAHYTGRDLSGQKLLPLRAQDVAQLRAEGITMRCEGCGEEAR